MSTIYMSCNHNKIGDKTKKMRTKNTTLDEDDRIKAEQLTGDVIQKEDNRLIAEKFDIEIDSLDDYFLFKLFSYLNLKEKLSIERVCKRWQAIIHQILSKQSGLGTTWSQDEEWSCSLSDHDHCVKGGDIREAIVMSNGWFYDLTCLQSTQNLDFISQKCLNVKCLHISHCIIDSDCFKQLLHFFPSLQCLHLKSNVLKGYVDDSDYKGSDQEWNEIGKVLGPFVQHLSLDPHYEHRMNEKDLEKLIRHFKIIKEFRVGTHFDRDVVGKFVSHLSNTCKLFYSLGREFSMEALNSLEDNQRESLTHLAYFSNTLSTTDVLKKIGETFINLVRLKVNLSYNEIILMSSSPISKLPNLQEFSLDLNTFSDTNVDDGLIWCIKDGLPSVKVLEISRACLSNRAFSSIEHCLPQLNKLSLKTIEIQCCCEPAEIRDKSERYSCSVCKNKCWLSVSNLKHLKELSILGFYFRNDRPKPFHNELCQLLPNFKSLRYLTIFRYDISSTSLFESLDQLMKKSDLNDLFILKLKSIPLDSFKRNSPRIYIIHEPFML